MKITKEMVEYVAALSRLKLSDQEKTEVQKDLGSIIDYIDMLNNVDTTDIEPMSHTLQLKTFQKRRSTPFFDREELLKNAPNGMKNHSLFQKPLSKEVINEHFELSALELGSKIKSGEISVTQATAAYLDKIEKHDKN